MSKLAAGTAALTVALACFVASAQAGTFTVTTLAGDSSAGSLHAAMDGANANPGDKDTISFGADVAGTIALTSDLPVLTGPVEINGPGSSKVTVNADHVPEYRLFRTSKDLTLTGLTLANAGNDVDGDNGGAISTTGSNLVMKDIHVRGSHSYRGNGGGAYVNGGSVTIEDSSFSNNTAVSGGGLWIHGVSTTSISNTVISNNIGTYYFFGQDETVPTTGGGLLIDGSTNVNIKDSTIDGNSTLADGAAFSIDNVQNVTIAGTTVADNETPFLYGAEDYHAFGTARIDAGNTTITDSQFLRSSTGASSLAGLQVIGPVNISRCTFAGNSSSGPFNGLILGDPLAAAGSPPVIDASTATVSDSTITGNSSGTLGGGLTSAVSRLNLESSTITGNELILPISSDANGAGLVQLGGTATVTNSIVSGNGATDITAVGTISSPNVPAQDFGGYVEGSYNLIGAANGRQFKDLVPGSIITSRDPKLAPLSYDGDALTQTMKPATDSPVIDQGLSSLPTDQNGLARTVDFKFTPNAPGGNGTDIGAVEVQSGVPQIPFDFTFGKVKLNKKKGTASLQVKLPGAGTIVLNGSKTVAKSSKTAKKKGTVSFVIKAKGKAAKTLKKKGKVKLKASFTFTPTGGYANTQTKTVKLAKSKPKKK